MVFGFKQNGELYMEKRDLLSGEIEEREAVVDVSCNWEDFAHFRERKNHVNLRASYLDMLALKFTKYCFLNSSKSTDCC